MIRAVPATAAMLAAGPALALPCLHPSIAGSFEEARAAEEIYAAVLGRCEFDRADLPAAGAKAATIPAIFHGRVLDPTGS